MRYIGSKEKLLPFIENAWRRFIGSGVFRVGDIFCGTAAVSRLFKQLGNKVIANDNLKLGYVFAQAALRISEEPLFIRLLEIEQVKKINGDSLYPSNYDRVLAYLNKLPGEEGFFFQEYSPGGTLYSQFERRYFSDENAKKIDAIRKKLSYWEKEDALNESEFCLLLTDLMQATNRVANTAGTYGCFMKYWDSRAQKSLFLQRSPIIPSPYLHQVFCDDANVIANNYDFDVLYVDPPYTWRHYGAYYHILETIAQGDQPNVSGRTGIRPWKETKSRYCDREDALHALQELITSARAKHIFLSYNDEGLISHENILDILNKRGKPVCMEIDYRRYRSNDGGTKRCTLKERLYYVKIQKES